MAQKKVGFSNTSYVQGDKLIINNGLTASINFEFLGATALSFRLPQADGSSGWAIVTDGAGNLSFGTVSGAGNVQGTGTTPKLAYWTGTSSLGSSLLEEGSGQLLFPAGTLANPGISFLLDQNTGFRRSANDQVSIVGGGSDLATFNSTGALIGAVKYTSVDGPATYVLQTDGAGNTSWVENIIGSTGATGPTGSYITGGYSVSQNELIFTLNTGGTVSVTGSFAGSSGTSGLNGSSGTSGANGTSGTSGQTGLSGTSGTSGLNGTSGTSGIQGATGSLDAIFIDGWLNSASYSTQISALTNNSNWSSQNVFIGSITSTYQGQRYYYNPFVYDAIDDNQWVRTTIGLGVTGPTGSNGTSGTSGISGANGTSGTSGISGANGTSGTSGLSGTSGVSGSQNLETTLSNGNESGTYSIGLDFYYAVTPVVNTTVSGSFTQSMNGSNTYFYTLTGNTTFGYSNPTYSVYNFFIKAGTYSFTLNSGSNWQTVGATALGFTGSFIISAAYDGSDMWVSTVKNYQSY